MALQGLETHLGSDVASVARTCSVGPRLFVVNRGRTADLQNRSALRLLRNRARLAPESAAK
jgi:hypothetical protein